MDINFDIANFIVGLIFSSASCVIAASEFASNYREKKKIKEDEKILKNKVTETRELLKKLHKHNSIKHELKEVSEKDFDTVTLSDCDFKEMCIQSDRISDDLREGVDIFNNAITVINEMIFNVINKENCLPKTCVSIALSMEDLKNTLLIKINIFENHLSELSWKCISYNYNSAKQYNNDIVNDKNQLEKYRNELYNNTYNIYLEYKDLCVLIKIVFEKYETILQALSGYAETLDAS